MSRVTSDTICQGHFVGGLKLANKKFKMATLGNTQDTCTSDISAPIWSAGHMRVTGG